MKKTCFLAMLTAALLGGQVFAEVTGTAVDNCGKVDGTIYYGTYSDAGSATGGNVTIKADEQGDVPNSATVYGGYSEVADACNNTVVMSGGTVWQVCGGFAKTNQNEASNNVVIVTAGTIQSTLCSGHTNNLGTAMNNKVYLVGKGATNVSIGSSTYTGGEGGIKIGGALQAAYPGLGGTSVGNSIDIYGVGITAFNMSNTQILTFNITDGQVSGTYADPALTLTSTKLRTEFLDLTNVELQVKDLDVQEWTPGKTITLATTVAGVTVGDDWGEGKEVEIKRGDVVTATATLKLNEDNTQLLLTNIQGVPEPATGSLSLLALAGLAARRRRK